MYARYQSAGIEVIKQKAEDYADGIYDIGIIYNVLQHVENPKQVIENAQNMCKLIRLFEFVDVPINNTHINTLTESDLTTWLGKGATGMFQNTKYFCGVFV